MADLLNFIVNVSTKIKKSPEQSIILKKLPNRICSTCLQAALWFFQDNMCCGEGVCMSPKVRYTVSLRYSKGAMCRTQEKGEA